MSSIDDNLIKKRKNFNDLIKHYSLKDKSINTDMEIRVYDLLLESRIFFTHNFDEYKSIIHRGINELLIDRQKTLISNFKNLISNNASKKKMSEEIELMESNIKGLSIDNGFDLDSRVINFKEKTGKTPAYIFVLNYDPDNKFYQQHCVGGFQLNNGMTRDCLGKSIYDDEALKDIIKIGYEDNAIGLTRDAIISGTNMYLNGIHMDYNCQKNVAYYESQGFGEVVHSRSFTSKGFSKMSKNTIIMMSEKGTIRRMTKGNIDFSSNSEELKNAYNLADYYE